MFIKRFLALSAIAVGLTFAAAPASALTMAECSAKYNSAKDANTLDDQSWNDFRKTQCGTDATTAAPAKTTKKSTTAAASDDAEAKGLTAKECSAKYNAAKDADALNGMKWNAFRKAECGPGASTAFVPAKAAVAEDDAAKGLTAKECSAKYNAAKDADALNGMKWNAFRKAECGPGASAKFVPAKGTAAAEDDAAKGLTTKQCGVKYQAAKDANALNGLKWNDFRKTQCGPGASAVFVPAKATKAAAADDAAKGLSMKDCSAKYQNAKADGSLSKGMKWNDFRKNECGANAAEDDTVPAFDEAIFTDEPEKPVAKAPRGVKFPNAISRKFSTETPAKARMHTCLEQYYVNKDAESLGGLRWIQKGGGYYSLCNARLKSES